MPTTTTPVSITKTSRRSRWQRRTWGIYNYASLWVAMSVCIPTYMLASGLIAGGMNWWQAVGTILLGNLIVLVPMLLNAHAGTKYGIPFPVSCARRSACAARTSRPSCAPWSPAAGSASRPGSAARPSTPCCRSSGPAARPHPGVDLDLLLRLLAAQHVRDLARHRDHPLPRRHRRALHARRRPAAALVDHRQGRRLRPRAQRPQQVSQHRRILALLHSRRSPAWSASGPPSRSTSPTSPATPAASAPRRSARRSGLPLAMTLYSFIGVAVTSASVVIFGEADLGPGRADRPLQPARRRLHRADRAPHRDAEHQRRRQRRLARRTISPTSTRAASPSAPAA